MSEGYSFDIFTAHHDDLKNAKDSGPCACHPEVARPAYREVRSRILISSEYTYPEASELAACMAVAVHGGMPTRILVRY